MKQKFWGKPGSKLGDTVACHTPVNKEQVHEGVPNILAENNPTHADIKINYHMLKLLAQG